MFADDIGFQTLGLKNYFLP